MIRLPDVTLTGAPFTVSIPGQPGRWSSMVLENESAYQLTVNYAGTQLIVPAWTADIVLLNPNFTNVDFVEVQNLPQGFTIDKTLSINLFEKTEPQPTGYPIALTRATAGAGNKAILIGSVTFTNGVQTPIDPIWGQGRSLVLTIPSNTVAVMGSWSSANRFNYISEIDGLRPGYNTITGDGIAQLAAPYSYQGTAVNNTVAYAAVDPIEYPQVSFKFGIQSVDDTYNFYALTTPIVYPVVNADDAFRVGGGDQLQSSDYGMGVQGVSPQNEQHPNVQLATAVNVGGLVSVTPPGPYVGNTLGGIWLDRNGRVNVVSSGTSTLAESGTATQSSVPSAISDTLLLTANAARLGATVYNDSTQILYLLLGTGAASSTNYTVQLISGAYFELPVPYIYTGQIRGIWAAVNGAARVTELT